MRKSDDMYTSAGQDACAFLEDVSFSYADFESLALDSISLSVERGEFLGIIGPSGSGKTTLASCLSGAIPHHYAGKLAGKILIEGKDSFDAKLTDISQIVGSVLQDIDAQMIASNVEDELLFGLENFGVEKDEIYPRLMWALETVGIKDLLHREIATLSGGQKQKVAIAAILALRPKVMVLDEPTCALDPASSRKVFETLRSLNEEAGITIVVIEQKVALLAEFCRRVAVLSKGSLAELGSADEVFHASAKLREIGVDTPRCCRLAKALSLSGVVAENTSYLCVDDAYRAIAKLLHGKVAPHDLAARLAEDTFDYGEAQTEVAFSQSDVKDEVLRFDGVSFSYGKGQAGVYDIDFSVRAGELVGIVGQNGAGKTTITKLMNGLLKPKSGSVVICGNDTHRVATSTIAKSVSTLFQNPDRQICKNSVLEEIAFSQELLGVENSVAMGEAKELCREFSLPADAAPFSLSRGQRQIVALASVLITKPKVLILDEPTSGLDYLECKIVMDAVEKLRKSGTAVIMVCHDMEVAADFATRLIVMAQGRVLFDGDKRKAFADVELMQAAAIRPPQVAELAQKLALDATLDKVVASAISTIFEVKDMASLIHVLTREGGRC